MSSRARGKEVKSAAYKDGYADGVRDCKLTDAFIVSPECFTYSDYLRVKGIADKYRECMYIFTRTDYQEGYKQGFDSDRR